MQLTPENLNYVLAFIALISVVFNVWNKISKPQNELDKKQALDNEETENNVKMLARELEIRNGEYNRRFDQLLQSGKEATATAQNHIHSIQVQVESLTTIVNTLNVEFRSGMTELKTIMNERLK